MLTHTLGYPRMGSNRELKKKLESYWRGEAGADDLALTSKKLRSQHWKDQSEAGVELLPVGDFSLYDHMLDNSVRFGCIPERYNVHSGKASLDDYFKMARGQSGENGIPAMEMTKWFDTNYHYIVPEFKSDQKFSVADESLIIQAGEAVSAGYRTKAVLPGPLTFLLLGKCADEQFDRLTLLENLIPAYVEFIEKLAGKCEWIQFDEPVLALDLDEDVRRLFSPVYKTFKEAADVKIMVATYFGGLGENLDTAASLPVDGLHVDLVRGGQDITDLLGKLRSNLSLSMGVVDGRNIWRSDLDKAIATVKSAQTVLGEERVMVSTSCSLLHVPFDLDLEDKLDDEIKSWMAFARQKCSELRCIADAALGEDVTAKLLKNHKVLESRKSSSRVNNAQVAKRLSALKAEDFRRKSDYPIRAEVQRNALGFPLLPTTTIGSFPQTAEVRSTRSSFKNNRIDQAEYEKFMHSYIEDCIRRQEDMGLDVLVHGEPERNDMVEYFGEHFDGYCFTSNGWVQSYGSRCVKPPVIYGDVSRPAPVTVDWINYAQSLSDKEVKGMLTGPVTILCWSFVRDDQPRSETCMQIALAVRDEVSDLEKSGVKVIQIDEPALREGLPLRKSEQKAYLKWAEDAFRLSASCVNDSTQIHTHMCYCEFDEIIDSIAALDADVISIEASRSRMELLGSFKQFSYPNEVGPGVYDIHSPAIPSVSDMEDLLEKALEVIPVERLWVNPDCGLKTRKWDEVEPSLKNMVQAAEKVRLKLK